MCGWPESVAGWETRYVEKLSHIHDLVVYQSYINQLYSYITNPIHVIVRRFGQFMVDDSLGLGSLDVW